MSFTLAIIGRPNVGKSTLFNRLVGKRLALVDDRPGVTRDRREGEGRLGHLRFTLIDTAGLEDITDSSMEGRMRAQTQAAIEEADVCLFLIDARAGVTPMDEYFAGELRKTGKPVVLAANKCEGNAGQAGLLESYRLGLDTPISISAEHGEGMSDLFDDIVEKTEFLGADENNQTEDDIIEDEDSELSENRPLRMAVVGRPNAGKSTLINTLIGEDRLLTGPEAGLTRDSIAVSYAWDGQPIRLFDTAGLRRKAKIVEKLEKLSVADTLRAIQFSEVVVLLVDATQPFEKQDIQIADLVEREGRALVIAVNKWDLVKNKSEMRAELEAKLDNDLPQLRGVPLIFISAENGKGLKLLMNSVFDIYAAWNKRITTAQLNKWLKMAVDTHNPPASKGRRIKLRYMTQSKTRPPTFVVFCSKPENLPAAYRRYLVHGLREKFGLEGTPIRLMLRKGDNPYDNK